MFLRRGGEGHRKTFGSCIKVMVLIFYFIGFYAHLILQKFCACL